MKIESLREVKAKLSMGKSGGYRVITFYAGTRIPTFLFNVFAKNEKTDLTPKERKTLKTILSDLVKAYRARGEKP